MIKYYNLFHFKSMKRGFIRLITLRNYEIVLVYFYGFKLLTYDMVKKISNFSYSF